MWGRNSRSFTYRYLPPFVERNIFTPLNCLGILVKSKWSWMIRFISEILFYWFTCLFICQYHTVLVSVALQYVLKLGSVTTLPAFFQDCPESLAFANEFQDQSVNFFILFNHEIFYYFILLFFHFVYFVSLSVNFS